MRRSAAEIVEAFACSGCGACLAVCSHQAIRMMRDAAGFLVAGIDPRACVSCGRCLAVCPGNKEHRLDDAAAASVTAFIGYAASPGLRARGQSGGVVSALVELLLATRQVDGAVLTRFNPKALSVESFCAHTVEEVRSAAGSCYCQSPVAAVAAAHRTERLAVVALGCQAQALARLREEGALSEESVVLGLVCAGNCSRDCIVRLVELAGVDPQRVKAFRFRDKTRGGWPGEVSISTDVGTVYLPAKVRAGLKSAYGAPVCLTCLDKLNSSADLVFGDPWGFDDRDRLMGESVVIVRTERGARLIREACARGLVKLEEIPVGEVVRGQRTEAIRTRQHRPSFLRRLAFAQSLQRKVSREAVRSVRLWQEGKRRTKGRYVLAYGFSLSSNFGGPSVAHGFREGLRQLHPDAQLVCYQPGPVDPVAVSDMDFPVLEYPYGKRLRRFLKDWLRQKFLGKLPAEPSCRRFWEEYRKADTIVNIYAICFCGNWGTRTFSKTRTRECLKYMLHQFLPNLIGRIDGKRSVKATSSFGPLSTMALRKVARWSVRWCFSRVVAREKESLRQLVSEAGVTRRIPVAPDLANLMPTPGERRVERCVGLVTSFQMERKWSGPQEGYLDCMTALVRHVRRFCGCRVILIANQLNGPDGRGDLELAHAIRLSVGEDDGVSVLDVARMGGLSLKRVLASCEFVVSPRYHACVAALSAGVPLLTLGWHHKYRELMALYGQDARMLAGEACTVASLVAAADEIWGNRVAIRCELARLAPAVAAAVVNSMREMLD